jgi:serine-type D-Ala-D-Ala carboxypeptidase (penicillin-binding protein 5/6)
MWIDSLSLSYNRLSSIRLLLSLPRICVFMGALLLGISSVTAVQTTTAQPVVSSPHWVLQHWPVNSSGGANVSLSVSVTAPTTLARNAADTPTPPASITKLMTAYVTLQAVAAGETTLTSVLTVSEQAVAQDGTRVGYRAGERVAVQDALQGMLAISGNDAAWALAQHVGGGDASVFISRMSAVSKALRLNRSQWQNPHGLTQVGHTSSAADLAMLAHALWRDYPVVRPWLGVKTYSWHGVTQSNRNSLLWRDATVDGLKTGHTDAAGYNLAATSNWRVAVDSDIYDWRLTSVVLGATSTQVRAADSAALLAWGRSAFVPWRLYRAGDNVGLVRLTGAVGVHAATVPAPVWLVLSAGTSLSNLRYVLSPAAGVTAPVAAGAVIATLNIYSGEQLLLSTPAVTPHAIARAPWYASLWAWVKSWFA